MEAVALRPPLVYGPGVGGNFIRLLRLAASGIPLPLGSVANARSMISATNLAGAIRLCLEHERAPGKAFLVRDGDDFSTPALIAGLRRAMGRPARIFPVPPILLRSLGGLVGRGATVQRLLDSFRLDDRQIRDDLGWLPSQAPDEALAETVDWFQGPT